MVTADTSHRSWCPGCRDTVVPVVIDAVPGATLGPRVVVLSAWLHSLLGTTLAPIIDVFQFHLQFGLSVGGLVSRWHRPRAVLFAWDLEIQAQALNGSVPHADETGWRVHGTTHGPWCFTATAVTSSRIDCGRGPPALKRFFTQEFAGVLVTDFWGASNAVVRARQPKCLPHLRRDLQRTRHDPKPGGDWPALSPPLQRLSRDALRLGQRRKEWSPEPFATRRRRLGRRRHDRLAPPWEQRHARRWVQRLRRHEAEWFTFLDRPGVPSDHHHAARRIRPAVRARKHGDANGGDAGAGTPSVGRSVFGTLKQRGHNPVSAVLDAVRADPRTGQRPPVPAKVAEIG